MNNPLQTRQTRNH